MREAWEDPLGLRGRRASGRGIGGIRVPGHPARFLAGVLTIRIALLFIWVLLGAWFPVGAQDLATPIPDGAETSPVLARADQIFEEVSRLRGLPIKNPVHKLLKDREFFARYFLKLLQRQYPVARKKILERAYIFYGFLSPGTDLVQSTVSALLRQVQGVYDPTTKTLYIADWVGEDLQEEVLAHELTHALQDQYFDLRAYLAQEQGQSMDYQFAHDSVMEGEAVALAMDYSLEGKKVDFTRIRNIGEAADLKDRLDESGQKAFGRKSALPDVADFPYVYGTSFLQKYVKTYGWQGMGYLFEHPPTSTHQVLHPETFFPVRHNPTRVGIEDLSPGILKGRSKFWEDSFGEYGLFLMLRPYLGGEEARNAVKGWRGDRFQLYQRSDHLTGVGYVIFEDEVSADLFFQAARSLLTQKYHMAPAPSVGDLFLLTLGGTGLEACVERRGKRVILVEGTEQGETAAARTALLKIKKRVAKKGKGQQ